MSVSILKPKTVSAGLTVCCVNSGAIVVSAHEGEQCILIEMSDCDNLCRPYGTRICLPAYPALRLRLRAGLNCFAPAALDFRSANYRADTRLGCHTLGITAAVAAAGPVAEPRPYLAWARGAWLRLWARAAWVALASLVAPE